MVVGFNHITHIVASRRVTAETNNMLQVKGYNFYPSGLMDQSHVWNMCQLIDFQH